MSNLLKLEKNSHGRDFVVGDIHFKMVEFYYGLQQLKFDARQDRIISVGDLIDRGPDVEGGLGLLDEPWFHMVMGNHEQMLIQAYDNDPFGPSPARGAAWWKLLNEPARSQIVKRLASLPIAIELQSEHGPVGIIHADVPIELSWSDFKGKIVDEATRNYALWGQRRVRDAIASGVPGVW